MSWGANLSPATAASHQHRWRKGAWVARQRFDRLFIRRAYGVRTRRDRLRYMRGGRWG